MFICFVFFMNEKKLKSAQLKILGMTCGSCELMLERKIQKIPGVQSVNVNYRTGIADITADAQSLPSSELIEKAIVEAGYKLEQDSNSNTEIPNEKGLIKVRIDGMSENNCKLLVNEKLKLIKGVQYVSFNYAKGTAAIHYKGGQPSWDILNDAVKSAGFTMRHVDEAAPISESPHQKWLEIGASLIIIFALYEILKTFDVISFVSSSTAGAATFGGVLLIGLVAGTSSCLAVTGGLLLSVAAKYNESTSNLTRWQKFKPLLYFNLGRLFSYFLLGGLVGVLGKSITLSPKMTGYLNVFVAIVMLYLALSILKIIPKGKFGIRPPKRLSHWIANISESRNPSAPFGLGMFTFFLPCGFTQSLQLVALASGSFFVGSMTMFIFALGTLPALLGISAISSTAKGTASRLFLRFSGALVLILALFNLNSGLLLAGVNTSNLLPSITSNTPDKNTKDKNVTEENGTQIINMNVNNYGYYPDSYTVKAGKPTIIRAIMAEDGAGCASVVTVPKFNLVKYLAPGSTTNIGPFTPTGNFLITCSMGMFTANVNVIKSSESDLTTKLPVPAPAVEAETTAFSIPDGAQVVDLEWTYSGYSPQILKVKRGSPTVVKISASAISSGCMETIVFPYFNESAFLPYPGEDPVYVTLDTVKAETGDYPITCGMGIRMGTLQID